MAETKGGVGLGWVWLLIALMVLIGVFLLSLAFFFPEGIELTQPQEAAPVEEPTPVVEEAITVNWKDVAEDPSPYYGKDVVVIARVTDIISDRALWLASRQDVGAELFAVVAKGIDLRATDFKVWQLVQVYGSIRQLQDGELKSQGIEVGSRTASYLSSEKGYLLIKGLIPIHPQPGQEVADDEVPPDEEALPGEGALADEGIPYGEEIP